MRDSKACGFNRVLKAFLYRLTLLFGIGGCFGLPMVSVVYAMNKSSSSSFSVAGLGGGNFFEFGSGDVMGFGAPTTGAGGRSFGGYKPVVSAGGGMQKMTGGFFLSKPDTREKQLLGTADQRAHHQILGRDEMGELDSLPDEFLKVTLARAGLTPSRLIGERDQQTGIQRGFIESINERGLPESEEESRKAGKSHSSQLLDLGVSDFGYHVRELEWKNLYQAAESEIKKDLEPDPLNPFSSPDTLSDHILPDDFEDMLIAIKLEPEEEGDEPEHRQADVLLTNAVKTNNGLLQLAEGEGMVAVKPFSSLQMIPKAADFSTLEMLMIGWATDVDVKTKPRPAGLLGLMALLAERKQPLVILEKVSVQSSEYGRVLFFDAETLQWSFQATARKKFQNSAKERVKLHLSFCFMTSEHGFHWRGRMACHFHVRHWEVLFLNLYFWKAWMVIYQKIHHFC